MRYIISDIHGCYGQYQMSLEKIHFSGNDKLYVLGDAVDRGPEPVKVLQDMMRRSNVIFILGNHDFILYTLMKKLSVEITADNYDKHLTQEILLSYSMWCRDSGQITADQFGKLSYSGKMEISDYIAESSLYEEIENNGKVYNLIQAGLANFSPGKDLDAYSLYDFLEDEVYRKNGHIAMDCGCVTGEKLAAFCVETEEVIYADGYR